MKRALFALLSLAIAVTAFAAWHVSRHIPIGGTGGWDYVSIDSVSRRAYVSHGDRVEVEEGLDGEAERLDRQPQI